MSKSILLIEDDRNFSESLQALLEFEGHTVEFVADGAQADIRLQGDAPALILLDLHIPGRSGLELLVDIRSNSRFRRTKVIVLTGDVLIPIAEMSLADGVLLKPVAFSSLLAAIQSIDDSAPLAKAPDSPMSSGFDD